MLQQLAFFPLEEMDKDSLDFNYKNFKTTVQTQLTWSKEDWNSKGWSNSYIHRLCNLMNYNYKQLKDVFNEKTLVITLYNVGHEAYIDLQALLNILKALIPPKDLLGYYRPRNRKIIGLDFTSVEVRNYVRDHLQKIGDNFVADLEWVSSSDQIDLRLHWVHQSISDCKIQTYLMKFMKIDQLERETEPYTMSTKIQTSLISIKATLHPGVSMDDVPHLTYFGGLQVLITIRGRVALCLSCETLGHVAAKCPRPFCRTCRLSRPKKHQCVTPDVKASYARAVASVANINKEQEQDGLLSDSEEDMELHQSGSEEEESVSTPPPPHPLQQAFPALKPSTSVCENPESFAVHLPTLQAPLSAENINNKPTKELRGRNVKIKKKNPQASGIQPSEETVVNQNLLEANAAKKIKTDAIDYTTIGRRTSSRNRTYGNTDNPPVTNTSENLFEALVSDKDSDLDNIFS